MFFDENEKMLLMVAIRSKHGGGDQQPRAHAFLRRDGAKHFSS